MKLILTQEVDGLGSAGDIVTVKDGYARNYLVPRGFATLWTKGAEKQIEQMRAAAQARAIASVEDARALRDSLESAPLVVRVKAGENGRLFGAVTAASIADALAAKDITVDRRRVSVPSHIKSVGDYAATVRVHDEITANLALQVRPA